MKRLRTLFRNLFHRPRVDGDLDAELRAHLELLEAEKLQQGLSPEVARHAARLELGGLEQVKEDVRSARPGVFLDSLARDLRFAARMLRKNPGFTAVAVLTLALGIGANTAIFSVVNAVLLNPLPYPHSEQLYTLNSRQSLPDLDDIRRQSRSFDAFGGVTTQPLDFTGESEPLQVWAALVNGDFFSALGVAPAIGRAISSEEDRHVGEHVVVLSHAFWQRHLGGNVAVLGKAIPLSGNSYAVIGVMPPDFVMPLGQADLWVPIRVANPIAAKFRGVHFLHTYLRMKPGASPAQAQAELSSIDRWLAREYPEENRDRTRRLIPLLERIVGDTRPTLLLVFGAVSFVLLIACVNFASLLLVRASARYRELAVRIALGAPGSRLIRQMLTESLLLAFAGGACGLLLARWGVNLLLALRPEDLPRAYAIGIDFHVLGFTFVLALLTGILFGLLPAWNVSKIHVNEALKEAGRTASAGAGRIQLGRFLVASETALALVLLIGAGLLFRSFRLLMSVDPGFRPQNILVLRLELPESRYRELPEQRHFRDLLLNRLNSRPGVKAAMISELPMSDGYLTHNFIIEGRPPLAPGQEPELHTRTVAGDYFRTMGIPLLRGRDFSAQDTPTAPVVVLVNERFVREYFPGQDPLSTRIAWARGEPRIWMTIIGVVGDVKHFGPGQPEEPAAYDLYAQTVQPWKRWMSLAVRRDAGVAPLLDEIKAEVWKLDAQIPLTKVETMESVVSAARATERFNLLLFSTFAAVALALAAVGIYGVLAHSVAQRTPEIGLRMVLGAQPREVLGLMIAQGMRPALAGGAVGILAAVALSRVMSSLLFGISPRDPFTFVAVALLLVGVALLACFVPALRAARVHPAVALRNE